MKIILASASPRRAQLFRQMNLEFETDPSDLTEVIDPDLTPSAVVMSLAAQKGRDVCARHSGALVVAADTIVVSGSDILGKPANKQEAAEMLAALSGETHDVFSGVWAAKLGREGAVENSFSLFERTKVTFSPLTQEEINFYVGTGSPMDKAGGYGIQDDLGAIFIREITGDYYNVVGFPMNAFYQKLKLELPKVHKEIFLHLTQ